MNDLFCTGTARRTNGALSVTMKAGARLTRQLQKLEAGGETVIKRTVSDFRRLAPGWVSKGIRAHYGISQTGLSKHAPRIKKVRGGFSVAGIKVDDAALEYKSELLTPFHFKMRQAKRSKKGMPGRISAEFIKGERKNLPPSAFLIKGKRKNGEAGPELPFQRRGAARYPLNIIKTVSVPHMIEKRAHDEIEKIMEEKLGARIDHHIRQAMK